MGTQHVVTGHDPHGKAVFVSVAEHEPATLPSRPGWGFAKLWAADTPPRFPDEGTMLSSTGMFPPLGGYRFFFMTIPPQPAEGQPPVNPEAVRGDMDRVVPGLTGHFKANNPGMHTSDSIDFGYVISGSIWLELDNGEGRELRAGDTFVQNGALRAFQWDATLTGTRSSLPREGYIGRRDIT
jgi:uncharacterized cupin superfamily protein